MNSRPFNQIVGTKGRMVLSLAFLLWSLLPHFSLVNHSHRGDGHGHSHASFSKEEIRLADQVLEQLAKSGIGIVGISEAASEPPSPQAGVPDNEADPNPSGSGDGWKPAESRAGDHGHYREDANLLALSGPFSGSPVQAAPSTPYPAGYLAPAAVVPGTSLARGPPISPFA